MNYEEGRWLTSLEYWPLAYQFHSSPFVHSPITNTPTPPRHQHLPTQIRTNDQKEFSLSSNHIRQNLVTFCVSFGIYVLPPLHLPMKTVRTRWITNFVNSIELYVCLCVYVYVIVFVLCCPVVFLVWMFVLLLYCILYKKMVINYNINIWYGADNANYAKFFMILIISLLRSYSYVYYISVLFYFCIIAS